MNQIKSFRHLPLLLCLLVATYVGCGKSENKATKQLVFFSQCNNAEPYRAAQNARFEALFKDRADVTFVISDGQADASKQISQIENAILQKPDVLIVAPLERGALTKVMGEAIAAGIPTICLERDIADPNYTTFVSCDNVAIGRMAGQFIVDCLTQKNGAPQGKLVELTGMQGVQAAKDRHDGAFEILQEYPEIEVVHEATGNWFQAEAMARMEEALAANSGIDVVYAHNDPMAYGAYLAAKEQGRQKDIAFVGVDGLVHEGQKYVEDGILAATFEYPLCVDKAFELTSKMLAEKTFIPEKTYILESRAITSDSSK